MKKLGIRIQHNCMRMRWLEVMKNLLDSRCASQVKAIPDPTGSLWGSCKAVLTSYLPDDTHVMVLQDDVLPCKDLIKAAERIIELLPNEPITLFSNSEVIKRAREKQKNWVKLRVWFMAQAYILPVALIKDMIPWVEQRVKQSVYMDDDRMATYMYYQGKYVYATAPCLVEHIGWNETTLRGYQPGHEFKPELRMASDYIGFEKSALDIDWTRGIEDPILDNNGHISMFCSNLKP